MLQRRLVLTVAALLSLVGVLAFLTMPRQEDPSMPPTWGMVIAPYPGADAEKVERLVVTRVEEQLAEVQQLKHVAVTIRQGVAVFSIQLRDDVEDQDAAWDEVETHLRSAQRELPKEVGPLELNRDLTDNQSIVLALTGSPGPPEAERRSGRAGEEAVGLG